MPDYAARLRFAHAEVGKSDLRSCSTAITASIPRVASE